MKQNSLKSPSCLGKRADKICWNYFRNQLLEFCLVVSWCRAVTRSPDYPGGGRPTPWICFPVVNPALQTLTDIGYASKLVKEKKPNLQCLLLSEEFWCGIVSHELHNKKWVIMGAITEHGFSVKSPVTASRNTARCGRLFYSIYINIQSLVYLVALTYIYLYLCQGPTGLKRGLCNFCFIGLSNPRLCHVSAFPWCSKV